MPTVIVHKGDESEELTVSKTRHDTETFGEDAGTEYIVLHGLQPSDQSILSAELTWLSGSMDDLRAKKERDYQKFPLVYVPVSTGEYEVEFADE